MSRQFTETALLIASGNKGKIKEISELLADYPVDIVSTANYTIQEPEETGSTFIDNAVLKARYYGQKTGLPALADDSGLSIDMLGGMPGIYSARWAGEEKDFSIAFNRIKEEVKFYDKADGEEIRAHFTCAFALWWPDGHVETVEGKVFGHLVFPPRGDNGFGYDPIFVADGQVQTFGEMAIEEKHAISHRADAFRKLVDACFTPQVKIRA